MNTENVSKTNHMRNKYSTITQWGENKTKVSLEIFRTHKSKRNKQLNTFEQVLFRNFINYYVQLFMVVQLSILACPLFRR